MQDRRSQVSGDGAGALGAGTHGEGSWEGRTWRVLASLGQGLPVLVSTRPEMMQESVPVVRGEAAILGRRLQASEMPRSIETEQHGKGWRRGGGEGSGREARHKPRKEAKAKQTRVLSTPFGPGHLVHIHLTADPSPSALSASVPLLFYFVASPVASEWGGSPDPCLLLACFSCPSNLAVTGTAAFLLGCLHLSGPATPLPCPLGSRGPYLQGEGAGFPGNWWGWGEGRRLVFLLVRA